MMPKLEFNINLPKEKWLPYYRGEIVNIIATTKDGLKVAFPANSLRPFVSRSGVFGDFEITYTEKGRFQSIKKIS